MKKLTISIVIPAYNEEELIERCVRSCLDQSEPAEEVIIVNNKSTDRTGEIVQSIIDEYDGPTSVMLVDQNEEQGLLPTRDKGFDIAKSDIIGRIDADAMITHGWCEAVRKEFAENNADAASGPVMYHDMPAKKFALVSDHLVRKQLAKLAKSYKFLFGTNMAIRRTMWIEMRDKLPFDANDEWHEDIDLALHFHENGYNVTYCPAMVGSMSARRLRDKPLDFYNYTMRFERTYKAHGLKSITARVPIGIYLMVYFPLRTLHTLYNLDEPQLSHEKLNEIYDKYKQRRARLDKDKE